MIDKIFGAVLGFGAASIFSKTKYAKGGTTSSKDMAELIDHINSNYDGVVASKTYSDNRIQVVSPFFNTLSEIKRKEFEGSGLIERYGNTRGYVLYSNKSYFAKGGMVDIDKYRKEFADEDGLLPDLFELYEKQPKKVRDVLAFYEAKYEDEGLDYRDLEQMEKDLNKIGWDMDYGLDAEPFGLRPLGIELSELKDYNDLD